MAVTTVTIGSAGAAGAAFSAWARAAGSSKNECANTRQERRMHQPPESAAGDRADRPAQRPPPITDYSSLDNSLGSTPSVSTVSPAGTAGYRLRSQTMPGRGA